MMDVMHESKNGKLTCKRRRGPFETTTPARTSMFTGGNLLGGPGVVLSAVMLRVSTVRIRSMFLIVLLVHVGAYWR